MNAISGVGFSAAWKSKTLQTILIRKKKITIPYIGLLALIKNKAACGRPKDLEDLKYLREAARLSRRAA